MRVFLFIDLETGMSQNKRAQSLFFGQDVRITKSRP